MGEDKYVQCCTHGRSVYAIICSHLVTAEGLEYLEVQESEVEENPWAWCTACDQVIVESEGNQEEIMKQAAWKLICIKCFESFKVKHRFKSYVIE